jgi:hypothetical protein
MIKKIKAYRLVSLLSLASLAFAAGGFFWALGVLGDTFGGATSGPLILHFNDMQGITSIGSFGNILWMGVLGVAIVVINFFIALDLEARDNVLGKIVAVMTLAMAILLFLAFTAIIKVN